MKEKRDVKTAIIGTVFCLVLTVGTLFAQPTSDADAGQKRLRRARALIAAHKLGAAAAELDAIRNSTTDDAVRDVARIMLMGVYLEEGDYMRAQSLLEETYRLRSAGNENSSRTYFALAGQAVNGTREHLARYKSFGINIADKELPPEAANDLEHARMLMDRIAQQAKEICSQTEKHFDALGLLEEVANVRGSLATTKKERLQWQREVADARERLSASEIRIASLGPLPPKSVSVTSPPPPGNPVASTSSSPADSASTHTTTATPDNVVRSPATPKDRTGVESDEEPGFSERSVEIGSLIDKATQRVSPSYPQTARAARISGIVTVYLEVDENGSVKGVQRTNGPQLLRQASVEAARRWKFRPTIVGGQPVRVTGFINFHFTL